MTHTRRQFLQLGATGMATLAVPALAKEYEPPPEPPIRPQRLRPGDAVTLVAPSGPTSEDSLARCVRNLEALGLKVRTGRAVREKRGNFAGTIAQRLDDLHAAFADRECKAVWAAHGGSGAIGLLPHIDYGLIRANPKILIGFSDITALLLAVHRRAGLVTFHGPNAGTTYTEYTTAHLRAVLFEPQPTTTIRMAESHRQRAVQEPQFRLRTLAGGVAEGPLLGGNLAMASALAGTLHGPDFDGAIVFLEDVNEPPYKLDRMFHHLKQAARMRHAAGVMLGVFDRCGPPDSDPSLTLDETVDEHFWQSPVPAAYGYSFGHVRDQFTIPLGVRARLDTHAQTLTLLEPAVS